MTETTPKQQGNMTEISLKTLNETTLKHQNNSDSNQILNF